MSDYTKILKVEPIYLKNWTARNLRLINNNKIVRSVLQTAVSSGEREFYGTSCTTRNENLMLKFWNYFFDKFAFSFKSKFFLEK